MEKISVSAANEISPVSLAFVGDAVFSLFVRQKLTLAHDCRSGELTRLSSLYVNASAQSKILGEIMPVLSADELAAAKRARNARVGSKAKNAAIGEYHRATGFEGLLGWLYLTGQTERLNELQEISFSVIERDISEKIKR